MIRRKVRLSLTSLAAAMLMLLSSAPVATAVSSGGNGLRVSPVRTDLTISPGQTQVVTIIVDNVTAGPATLQGVFNDFTANPDESGNPVLLLAPDAYAPGHSLKRFVAPISNFTLAPGQEIGVPVTITIPKGTAGGGYYGAVRFAPAVINPSAGQNVSLAGSVGSLILVKVPGNIKEQLTIASFDVRREDSANDFFTSGKDLTVTTRFQNEGNIQESPFGKILLKNRSNKVLATYEINNVQPLANVLPDSIRKFSIPLTHVTSFGEYKLEGNFGYGASGQLLSASTTFYVIPLWLIIVFIAIVLLVVFIVWVLPKLIKAYNSRVIRKARRR
jgi:hypothetical protein